LVLSSFAATRVPRRSLVSSNPQCCWYQSPNASRIFGSKKNPPIPVTFSISVPPAIPPRTTAPQGSETFGCMAVCADAELVPIPHELDPKANDRVRSSWRLRKASHPPFRESAARSYDTCGKRSSGSIKMRLRRIVGYCYSSTFGGLYDS